MNRYLLEVKQQPFKSTLAGQTNR